VILSLAIMAVWVAILVAYAARLSRSARA